MPKLLFVKSHKYYFNVFIFYYMLIYSFDTAKNILKKSSEFLSVVDASGFLSNFALIITT